MYKKAPIKRFNVGSSKHDFLEKPFGFCCDIKEQDPKKRYKLEDSRIEFPPNDLTIGGGGPNIRFRVQEGGHLAQPVQRNLKAGVPKAKTIKTKTISFETMHCKRCRGPLQWHLEDEISAARDIIANKMQTEYNTELEKNVNVAMEKERRKQRKLKKMNAKLNQKVESVTDKKKTEVKKKKTRKRS